MFINTFCIQTILNVTHSVSYVLFTYTKILKVNKQTFLYKHAFYFEVCHCLRTLSCLFIMRCCFLSAGSSFLFVNTSGRYGGQRAQLLLPPLRENDTHCLSFLFYQVGGREGAVPATLNVYIKGTQDHWRRLDSVGGALR